MALLEQRNPRPMYESIDPVHQAIHERGMYTISRTWLAVGNNAYADLRLLPPAGYEAHTRFIFISEGKARLTSYISTTYTANGTAIIPFNRVTDGDSSPLLAYHTPTINVLGTARGDDFIAGGTGGNSSGGSANPEFETVVAPLTDFLIRVQNVAGTAKDINIIVNYYLRKR